MTTENEPSIEEILESIRQIISDDSDATSSAGEDDGDDDVFELVDRVEPVDTDAADADTDVHAPVVVAQKPDVEIAGKADIVTQQPPEPAEGTAAMPETAIQTPPETVAEVPTTPVAAPVAGGADELVSAATASAAAASMAKLLSVNVAVEKEVAGRVGAVTLEDMALELMRPLIREWLDQNLAAIVEKKVEQELSRISKKA